MQKHVYSFSVNHPPSNPSPPSPGPAPPNAVSPAKASDGGRRSPRDLRDVRECHRRKERHRGKCFHRGHRNTTDSHTRLPLPAQHPHKAGHSPGLTSLYAFLSSWLAVRLLGSRRRNWQFGRPRWNATPRPGKNWLGFLCLCVAWRRHGSICKEMLILHYEIWAMHSHNNYLKRRGNMESKYRWYNRRKLEFNRVVRPCFPMNESECVSHASRRSPMFSPSARRLSSSYYPPSGLRLASKFLAHFLLRLQCCCQRVWELILILRMT